MKDCSIIALKDVRPEDKPICYSGDFLKGYIRKVIGEEPSDDIHANVATINKHLKTKDQTEWISKDKYFEKEELRVKPVARWDKKSRLVSNVDVYNVMQRYEKYNSDFVYVGDYDHDVMFFDDELERLNHNLARKGKYYAIMFSLYGKKWKNAKHWTMMYFDSDSIYFFDSIVDPKARYQICGVVEHIRSRFPSIKRYMFNTVSVQYDYEHCGIFAIHFVHCLLVDGLDFDGFLDSLSNHLYSNGVMKREEYYSYVFSLREKYFIVRS